MARSASSQPSTGTSSTSGAAAASRAQVACGTKPASTATRRAPTRADEIGPARLEVAVDLGEPRVRRLAPGLDRVARVGEEHDLVAPDQELARRARDLVLAVLEREAGQVAGVLGPDAEVRVDAGVGEPGAQPGQASGPGRPVGVATSGRAARRRAAPRSRPAGPARRTVTV